jgi:mono/diheme cytochrome c family protein
MSVRSIIASCALALASTFVQPTSWAGESDQGQAYYLRYCGSCHGIEGKGDGPVSRSLKVKPADLTQLRAKTKEPFRRKR